MTPGHQVSGDRRRKTFEILEHTADLRIRVRAKDLKALFVRTAEEMFVIIAEQKKKTAARGCRLRIRLTAENLDELFVAWLNELLSLAYSRKLIFTEFRIEKISEHILDACVAGRSSKDFVINKEIKAATYHQLEIEETQAGWKTEVIFDV